jgi:hypothetical protein
MIMRKQTCVITWLEASLLMCFGWIFCSIADAQGPTEPLSRYFGKVGINGDPAAELHILPTTAESDPTIQIGHTESNQFVITAKEAGGSDVLLLGDGNYESSVQIKRTGETQFPGVGAYVVHYGGSGIPIHYFGITADANGPRFQAMNNNPESSNNNAIVFSSDSNGSALVFLTKRGGDPEGPGYGDPSAGIKATYDTVFLAEKGRVAIGYFPIESELDNIDKTHRLIVNGSIWSKDGALALDAISTPTYTTDADSQFYSLMEYNSQTATTETAVYVKDIVNGLATRLNSHADPRNVNADARTSFADPDVELPFSFQHKSELLGRGAIIDMSKLVRYVENKMQEELGDEEGRVVFAYDLPSNQRQSVEALEASMLNHQAKKVSEKISELPWIPVQTGRSIPEEATEIYEEARYVRETITITEDVLDFESMKIVNQPRQKEVVRRIPTGRRLKRLRNDWKFENGQLCRRPTAADVDLNKIIDSLPEVSPWIKDRLLQRAAEGESLLQSINEIREALAQRIMAEQEIETSQIPEN